MILLSVQIVMGAEEQLIKKYPLRDDSVLMTVLGSGFQRQKDRRAFWPHGYEEPVGKSIVSRY